MKRDIEVEEDFYKNVAEILGVSYVYKPFRFKRPTRWNNRNAGNGRFEGFGLVRMFSPTCIHLSLKTPIKVNRFFTSPDDVYSFLKRSI